VAQSASDGARKSGYSSLGEPTSLVVPAPGFFRVWTNRTPIPQIAVVGLFEQGKISGKMLSFEFSLVGQRHLRYEIKEKGKKG